MVSANAAESLIGFFYCQLSHLLVLTQNSVMMFDIIYFFQHVQFAVLHDHLIGLIMVTDGNTNQLGFHVAFIKYGHYRFSISVTYNMWGVKAF